MKNFNQVSDLIILRRQLFSGSATIYICMVCNLLSAVLFLDFSSTFHRTDHTVLSSAWGKVTVRFPVWLSVSSDPTLPHPPTDLANKMGFYFFFFCPPTALPTSFLKIRALGSCFSGDCIFCIGN